MALTHLFAAALLAWIGVQSPAQMDFVSLARGDQSQIEETRTAVARTAAEWTALWKQHAGDAKPPTVDLSRFMVVGVFLGTRPTAGYSVEIVRIEKQNADLVVTYREQRPAPGDMVAQVLTSPFHLVRTDAFAGAVKFQRGR